jgi:hypothetical protein
MEINVPGLKLLAKVLSARIDNLQDANPDEKKEKDELTQMLLQIHDELRRLKS